MKLFLVLSLTLLQNSAFASEVDWKIECISSEFNEARFNIDLTQYYDYSLPYYTIDLASWRFADSHSSKMSCSKQIIDFTFFWDPFNCVGYLNNIPQLIEIVLTRKGELYQAQVKNLTHNNYQSITEGMVLTCRLVSQERIN